MTQYSKRPSSPLLLVLNYDLLIVESNLLSMHPPVDIDPTNSERPHEQNRPLWQRCIAGFGAFALAGTVGLGATYKIRQQQVGQTYEYSSGLFSGGLAPGASSVPVLNPAGESLRDSELRIASWNMHNELGNRFDEIKTMLYEDDLDVLMLQEVSKTDAARLSIHIPGYTVFYTVADTFPQGDFPEIDNFEPFGNAIITNTAPTTVESTALSGTSDFDAMRNFIPGFVGDVNRLLTGDTTRPTWQNSEHSRMNTRAATAVQFTTLINGKPATVNAINSHFSYVDGGEMQKRQFSEAARFIDTLPEADVTVFCSDFNTENTDLLTATFPNLESHETDATFGTRTIDFCFTETEPTLRADVAVYGSHETDHRALLTTIKEDATAKPATTPTLE